MAKQIEFGEAARSSIKAGVDALDRGFEGIDLIFDFAGTDDLEAWRSGRFLLALFAQREFLCFFHRLAGGDGILRPPDFIFHNDFGRFGRHVDHEMRLSAANSSLSNRTGFGEAEGSSADV